MTIRRICDTACVGALRFESRGGILGCWTARADKAALQGAQEDGSRAEAAATRRPRKAATADP